ncbi:MAG: chemotaxis protein CheW [Allosphingosinicella sp.]|uniref:chemotaxis protein CheW n=1 Tax=Allosphingosinicella sp. TaxID=2823234 RepID=UPI003957ADFB
MADLFLIVRLCGARVAVPAGEVDSVVEIEALTPVPRAAPHVAGLAALRSRVLTVIDAQASLGLGAAVRPSARDAVAIPCDGHLYAILVEEVEDVVAPPAPPVPLRAPLAPGWDRVGTGMVEVDGDLLLVVDPRALIAGPQAQAAA